MATAAGANPERPRNPTIRKRVLEEILSTEVTFVKNQKTLTEVYIEPLRTREVLGRDDIASIFSNWEMLAGFNAVFLKELQQAMASCMPPEPPPSSPGGSEHGTSSPLPGSEAPVSPPVCEMEGEGPKIGALFKKFAPYLRMFSHYLGTFDRALECAQECLKKNSKFAAFVEEARRDPRCRGLDLPSFLILPVQRIPRYKLLLQSLIEHTSVDHHDYRDLLDALSLVSAAASHNNEHIRRTQNMERLTEVQACFEADTEINLFDSPSREFVREGVLLKQAGKGPSKRFAFWLFSDKLLYGQKVGRAEDKYKLYREVDLRHCRVTCPTAESGVPDSERAFVVEITNGARMEGVTFTMWGKDVGEQQAWFKDLTQAIEAIRLKRQQLLQAGGDTMLLDASLREPEVLPESSIKCCELCDARFTVLRGRHHCRLCPKLTCANCAGHRVLLKHLGDTTRCRVCDACYESLCSEGKVVEGGGGPESPKSSDDHRRSSTFGGGEAADVSTGGSSGSTPGLLSQVRDFTFRRTLERPTGGGSSGRKTPSTGHMSLHSSTSPLSSSTLVVTPESLHTARSQLRSLSLTASAPLDAASPTPQPSSWHAGTPSPAPPQPTPTCVRPSPFFPTTDVPSNPSSAPDKPLPPWPAHSTHLPTPPPSSSRRISGGGPVMPQAPMSARAPAPQWTTHSELRTSLTLHLPSTPTSTPSLSSLPSPTPDANLPPAIVALKHRTSLSATMPLPATYAIVGTPPPDAPGHVRTVSTLPPSVSTFYPYASLRKSLNPVLPSSDMDPAHREAYLSDADFETVLHMPRHAFYALPRWRQKQEKERVDLF